MPLISEGNTYWGWIKNLVPSPVLSNPMPPFDFALGLDLGLHADRPNHSPIVPSPTSWCQW